MGLTTTKLKGRKYRAFTRKDIDNIPQLKHLGPAELTAMKAVSWVLPFRVNSYVIDELIDWQAVPEDPIYQLTFPQAGMLEPREMQFLIRLVEAGANEKQIQELARKIQLRLNPHPAGQMELNVPKLSGRPLRGMQHKYRETVLYFPSRGQTCHAYCTYCFRWAQFVGLDALKFASREAKMLERYVRAHAEVQDVLLTGGDPLVMRTAALRSYIEPLLEIPHLVSVRIGTKATAYWPYRFLTDPDADDLMRLFQDIRKAGKHLALMSHYCHPRELATPAAQAALRRIVSTGAAVRCQAPLVRHVNDSAKAWADLWRLEVRLGAVPYYMFVERDTGPKNYFEVSLAEAAEIFHRAFARVSGLGRTVRGPSMSATPGKVVIKAVSEIQGEKVFVLEFIQARDPSWVGRLFFARFDRLATWLDQLVPAFGEEEFFFEPAMRRIRESSMAPAWGNTPARQDSPTLFGHVEWE